MTPNPLFTLTEGLAGFLNSAHMHLAAEKNENQADLTLGSKRNQMIRYLFSIRLQDVMDVKDEDTSEESKRNHILYYKSLTKTVADIQNEKSQEDEPAIKNHLDSRIEAMEKDMERIRGMFPDIREEEWNDDTD